MKQLEFKFVKIHPKAIVPEKIGGNLGFDLSVVRDENFFKHSNPSKIISDPTKYRYVLQAGKRKVFHTGLKMAIPNDYGVVLWDRSGMAVKRGTRMCAGCFDSSYRGEWLVCLHNTSDIPYEIIEGDRIIQAIVIPEFKIRFSEEQSLDDTFRGEGGFGASGR